MYKNNLLSCIEDVSSYRQILPSYIDKWDARNQKTLDSRIEKDDFHYKCIDAERFHHQFFLGNDDLVLFLEAIEAKNLNKKPDAILSKASDYCIACGASSIVLSVFSFSTSLPLSASLALGGYGLMYVSHKLIQEDNVGKLTGLLKDSRKNTLAYSIAIDNLNDSIVKRFYADNQIPTKDLELLDDMQICLYSMLKGVDDTLEYLDNSHKPRTIISENFRSS